MLLLLIPLIIALILSVIGQWKVLEKGGRHGWASLIPFYGQYEMCMLSGVNPWWILIVVVSPFVPFIGKALSSFAAVYFNVILSVSVARSFGKDDSYGIGLLFLSPIFYLILGFGKSEYSGPNPMKDAILDSIMNNDSEKTNQNNNNNTQNVRYCSNCGSKVEPNTKYCGNCGKEI